LGKNELGKKLKNQHVIDSLTPDEARKLAKMAGNPLKDTMIAKGCERLRDQERKRTEYAECRKMKTIGCRVEVGC